MKDQKGKAKEVEEMRKRSNGEEAKSVRGEVEEEVERGLAGLQVGVCNFLC